MKWFKFKSTKRIEELEKKIEELSGKMQKLKGQVEESDKLAGHMVEHNKNINKIHLEKIESLSERTGKNELMFTAVFKKAQDTFSRSMRALVTQTGRNNQFIMTLAGEKLKEIEDKYQEVISDLKMSISPVDLLETAESNPTKIIVNMRKFNIDTPEVSYAEIIELAAIYGNYGGDLSKVIWTVSFRHEDADGAENGFLKKGEKVTVKEGMIFNVSDTSNA